MPKKHTPSYAHTKPKPTYGSASPTSSSTPSPLTVNERIQQLRREQAPKSTAQRRDEITEVVTKRTVPPQLRRILQMAEVDYPLPKPGTRPRPQRPGARPPPGPAAPSSWLTTSRHAPSQIRNLRKFRVGEGRGAVSFCPLALLHDAEYKVRCPQINCRGGTFETLTYTVAAFTVTRKLDASMSKNVRDTLGGVG
jgi:hypothetical protein